jgi:hypothetical protein
MINGKMESLLIEGGQLVKSLSIGFLADFEQHWRSHGKTVLGILAEKYPQAYFAGAVALAKSIKWETAEGVEAQAQTGDCGGGQVTCR